MSKPLTPFQRHLLFFSTPTHPTRLTLYSSLRAALSLGLDFPVALILSLSLRMLYAPYPHVFRPINVERIPASRQRSQISHAMLVKEKYTCGELLKLLKSENGNGKGFVNDKINQGHVVGFWAMAADARTNRVRREDVERFQDGEWAGGPIWVSGHSSVVRKVLGVRVYEGA
ncbi:hypothetical protein CC86DRAFT_447636 [Ophiobolus disseminans]|uniref:Uncharacterized protein n=1 Tax=Ophiobolus disseminans TaxID=1469910 RepID=A0A6A6ZTF1_9PLEO|nr:hypothetical protein CC86DRAFT_447636 [Ophiobolus disseminans]